MRISIVVFLLIYSFSGLASEDQINDLFKRYQLIMESHQAQYIDEVFTSKYLKSLGGEKTFAEKVKQLPRRAEKDLDIPKLKWKKGLKDNIFFVNIIYRKQKSSQFIVVEEDGKLKIDGTLSDE